MSCSAFGTLWSSSQCALASWTNEMLHGQADLGCSIVLVCMHISDTLRSNGYFDGSLLIGSSLPLLQPAELSGSNSEA